MTTQLYTGEIDWEKIYSTFHAPSRIAQRVVNELDGSTRPLIFSGFAETAVYLAERLDVRFIDLSPTVTTRASERFVSPNSVQTGDVTELVASYPNHNIVIACRISAYWGSEEFDRLARSLRTLPRQRVIIDFFDRDVVALGETICFDAPAGSGDWFFLEFSESRETKPPITEAKLTISYSLPDSSFSYDGNRAFFRKKDIERWCATALPGYQARICAPLVDADPSFTLVLADGC